MPSVYDWSATPSSNSSVGGVNIAEGMSPALVNDAIRMALSIIRQTFDPSLQNFLNASQQLPIANGGTGAATAPAALAALGGLSSAYRDLPITAKNSSFTVADAERGGGYLLGGSTGTITINPSSTTPITAGGVYAIANIASGSWTIALGSGVTINKNGVPASSIVIATGGSATLIHWIGDYWTCNGVGLS